MDQLKPKTCSVSEARDYFFGELREAMEKHQVSAKEDSQQYLVDLILRYIKSENFFAKGEDGSLRDNVLTDLYIGYLQGSPETRLHSLRRLGDICMLVTGFFPDSLNRKLVDLEFYFGMGGAAYHHLSRLQFTDLTRSVFQELSAKFKPFSDVLGVMSERTGLQNNTDLLRLYERWMITGSTRLKTLLVEQGIAVPFSADPKVKH